MDIDLDAYADDEEKSEPHETQPVALPVEPKRVSVLEAAERAGMPLDELLPKLD